MTLFLVYILEDVVDILKGIAILLFVILCSIYLM